MAESNNTGHDDSRKRDSTKVVEGDVVVKEVETKKLRANSSRHTGTIKSSKSCSTPSHITLTTASSPKQCISKSSNDLASGIIKSHSVESPCVDGDDRGPIGNVTSSGLLTKEPIELEVALQRLVRMGGGDDSEESKEFLSKDNWVKFRLGHAGDASILATCYRKTMPQRIKDSNNKSPCECVNQQHRSVASVVAEDTSLEVRLAEGLGDEDTPPSVFALIGDVMMGKGQGESKLGTVALVSIAWENNTRILRVEWLYVDKDDPDLGNVVNLLERRMWLRLSALAVMTSCHVLVANGVKKLSRTKDEPTASPT